MEAILEQNGIELRRLSGARVWTGYILSGLSSLFFLFDAILKLFKPAAVIKGTVALGYSEAVIIPLGLVLTIITLMYIIPRTAVLGAVMLTGYLGGAVATHVRVGNGAFEIAFPIVFGALVWGGLYLRDSRVAGLLPIRK